ncbi:Fs(2)Ket: Importin subunit beta, partial [Bienertia sinuspersici]
LFFTVYVYHHFYVLVINTKSKSIEIIDNRPLPENVEFSSNYHDWPEQIKMNKYSLKLLTMPWRTDDNNIDCGVYIMRHMKNYYSKRNWDCGLKADNFDALKKLRINYTNEIFTSEVNKSREELIDNATTWFDIMC